MRELRENAGFSREALSRYLNVSMQTISDWEKGKTLPRIDKAADLAGILRVSLVDLAASVGIDVSEVLEDNLEPLMAGEKVFSEEEDAISNLLKALPANAMAFLARNLKVPLKELYEACGLDTTDIPDNRRDPLREIASNSPRSKEFRPQSEQLGQPEKAIGEVTREILDSNALQSLPALEQSAPPEEEGEAE